MRLEKLTSDNIKKLNGKRLYVYEKSESYLRELEERFGIIKNIAGIIDDFKRNQGMYSFQGKEIQVTGNSVLQEIEAADSVIIITSDYYKEAYERLCKIENINDNMEVIYYFANQETEYEEVYRERYKNSLLENIIVFRSGPHASSYVKGMDFSDNARALFEYMLEIHYNEKYELVWLVKSPKEFERYSGYKNVTFLCWDWSLSEREEERAEYYRVLCLAKYFFFTDAYGFARNCREDQVRVQLWHGCGFKTRVNFVRCEKRYEYTTVISDLYAKIHADIYGLREDQVLVTGYAKQDWLFHPIEKERLVKLGIQEAEKYIFWLPTFRTTEKKLKELNEYELDSDTGLPIVNDTEKLKELNELLKKNRIVLLIKLHPFQNRASVKCEAYSNIVLLENEQLVEQDIMINQLLGWADALVSDYSSAAVDYMLLDRPIAFTLDDVEEYASGRGFVFENIKEWLPGKEVFGFKDYKEFIEEIAAGVDLTQEKRRYLIGQMHKYCDAQSCRRIISEVIK